MAGISGMPSGTRADDVQAPVPGASAAKSFDEFEGPQAQATGKAAASFDDFAASGAAAPQSNAMVDPNSLGGKAVQMGADLLPSVGGIGGMVTGAGMGMGAGGFGAIPGGMAGGAFGGAIGQQLKQAIEAKVLGKDPGKMSDQLMSDAKEAVLQGLGGGIGEAANVAGRASLATGAGKAVAGAGDSTLDKVVNAATPVVAYVKSAVSDAYNKLAEPVLNILDSKTTALNTEQSGDAVKKLFYDDISKRFGTFVKSYKVLDDVASNMKLSDDSKLKFLNGVAGSEKNVGFKAWAADNYSGDYYRMAQKYSDDMAAAPNGKAFNSVVQQMNDAAQEAYDKGKFNESKALRAMRDQATDWYESQITGLASKVAKGAQGGANANEQGFIQQLNAKLANDGLNAKEIAQSYLDERDTVKASYAKFRSFLEDVGEQTKVRAEGSTPMQFLHRIQDVPSEKLIEKMFDPKNAQALRAMQTESPGVFDQVVKSKMSQLVEKASAGGSLDLQELRKQITKMPGSTRDILLSPAEQKTLNDTLTSPKFGALSALEKSAQDGLIEKFHHIAALAGAVGQKGITDIGKNLAAPVIQQSSVMAARPLANAYFPQNQQQGPPKQ